MPTVQSNNNVISDLSLFLARISQILTTTTSSNQRYLELVRELKEYMRHKKLPEHMQNRFLTYYEFRFQKSYFKESEILSTISGQLRQVIDHNPEQIGN